VVLAREPFSRFTTPETLNGTGKLHTRAIQATHTRNTSYTHEATHTRDRDMQRQRRLATETYFSIRQNTSAYAETLRDRDICSAIRDMQRQGHTAQDRETCRDRDIQRKTERYAETETCSARQRGMQSSSLLGARAIFMAICINIDMRYVVMHINTDGR
jgi:hypothetical protein